MLAKEFLRRCTFEELTKIKNICAELMKEKGTDNPTKIIDSRLSIRAINSLYELGVFEWTQLIRLSKDDIHKLRGVGLKTVDEICKQMDIRGLEFKK